MRERGARGEVGVVAKGEALGSLSVMMGTSAFTLSKIGNNKEL